VVGTGKTVTFAIKHRMHSPKGERTDADLYDAGDERIGRLPQASGSKRLKEVSGFVALAEAKTTWLAILRKLMYCSLQGN
jgi:hypothetical protein